MATTLADLNSIINDRRRDTTSHSIDMTGDGFRAINGALDVWNQIHDWPWQIETTVLKYHSGINSYTLPSRFKAAIDLRPSKSPSTEFRMVSQNSFDTKKIYPNRFAISTKDRKQRLLIQHAEGASVLLHALNSLSSNGTVTAGGDISNLTADQYESYLGKGSLKFDYSGTSGTITITGLNPMDLSRFQDRSAAYLLFNPSVVSNFTSISLKIGSGPSDYYSITATTDHLGDDLVANQANRIKFNWANQSTTGSPDITAIDYLQITIVYGSDPSATAMRVEDLFISEDIPLQFDYYTTNMVYDVSGDAYISNFNDATATTDYPLLSGDWDYAREQLVTSVLQYIFFMTGEFTEYQVVVNNIEELVKPLRDKLPSKRRKPEFALVPDVNF